MAVVAELRVLEGKTYSDPDVKPLTNTTSVRFTTVVVVYDSSVVSNAYKVSLISVIRRLEV